MGGFFSLIQLVVLIFTVVLQTQISKSAPDYTTLVYKGCSKQPLSDPSASLQTLFSTLLQQASRSKFYKTDSGGGGGSQSSISGLYQCRGDLSNADCYNCIQKLPQLSDQLCGKVAAARIQLMGCYLLYEVSGFTQISGLQMLYKECSRNMVSGSGFEMKRDSALTVMENGITSNGNGNNGEFYTTNYQGLYVMGQCQGDLSSTDCGQCVKTAVQKAQVECGSSVAGQVYLHKCFISYNYSPGGVPTKSSSFSSGGITSGNTGKTVAIIVGVTAGVGFLIIMVLFMRGLKKKDDDF